MARNPKWTRDEVILALDLYFRVSPLHSSENHPEIAALSDLLNHLPEVTHPNRGPGFRNRNGVYMKLCNFLHFDPSYHGKGLSAGSKLDEEIWNEFAQDRDHLEKTANAIRRAISKPTELSDAEAEAEALDDLEFPEGRVLSRLHTTKERNARLITKKKRQALDAKGALTCEVCGFDFEQHYGELGRGFAECHHLTPLSDLDTQTKTKLSDLAIVCANCHRMLHRARPWRTVAELKKAVQEVKGST